MLKNEINGALLQMISPITIQKYVTSFGWRKITKDFDNMILLENPAYQDVQLLIPLNPDFSDYSLRVRELIENLSLTLNKSQEAIVNELLLPISDVIRFRIQDDNTKQGTFSFNKSIELLNGIRDILYSSALSVIKPEERYHKRLHNQDAEEFVNSCRLGQTERGSFVASVICPIQGQTSLIGGGLVENFGRKTINNMLTSLNYLTTTINSGDIEKIISPPQGKPNITLNLCEALTELQPSEQSFNLAITVRWAPELKPSLEVPSEVILKEYHYPHIRDVIEKLSPEKKPTEEKLIGKVSALKGTQNENERMEGDVLLVVFKDEEAMKAKVYLTEADHTKAIRAYEQNLLISITGRLVWAPNMKQIVGYREFNIVENIS